MRRVKKELNILVYKVFGTKKRDGLFLAISGLEADTAGTGRAENPTGHV